MAEMSPERRIILAFALSFLVLVGWSAYMREVAPPPETSPAEEAPLPPPSTEVAPVPPTPALAGVSLPETKQGTEERTITVETSHATITFSTRGAVVQSWTLKHYRDQQGEPLDLAQGTRTGLGFPLEIALDDPQQEVALNQALFVSTADGVPASATLTAPVELVFEWSAGQFAAEKRFRFPDGYTIEVETRVWVSGEQVAHQVAWRGGFGEPSTPSSMFPMQFLLRTPEGLLRTTVEAATQTTGWLFKSPPQFPPYTGEASYAGIEDQYFAAVFFPENTGVSAAVASAEWTPPGEGQKPQKIGALALGAAAGDNRFRLFVGPKAIQELAPITAPVLSDGTQPVLADELIDYGWFWWVAKPLFLSMQWIYENVWSNYGWVIVILTLLINTIIFPLKYKSMLASVKMQKLAPQMRAIQDKYKKYKFNDPRKQQQQQEVMALYRQHGVNPMGSCLPMLLQLPFFYGFYKVLASSIELRQAPWFGWVQDLSQPDPYYILPVVMALAMYLSMKMTPMTTADPGQQKLMQFMPLMFGFFFLSFPAGLVLYWLMSSVAGVGQQWWINKRQREHEQAEKLAAKERKKQKRRGQQAGNRD